MTNPYVRVPRDLLGLATASGPAAPDDPRGVHLIQDPTTAAVSDLFNACYAAMLQLLYRFFQHTEETDEGARDARADLGADDAPGDPAAGRAADQAAGRAAGAGVDRRAELHVDQRDPVTPHKPAAWSILGERLLELAEVCGGLTAEAPEVLAEVGERLAAFAAPLLPPDAAGRRPEADVPALAVDPLSGDPAPSFDRDIRPLFTARDRAAMRWSFDLGRSRRRAARRGDPRPGCRGPHATDGAWSAGRWRCSADGCRRAAQTDEAAYDLKFSQWSGSPASVAVATFSSRRIHLMG